MIHKLMGAGGFVLVILGIGCIDSPSLYLPIAMIASGVVLAVVSAGGEGRWTESEGAQCRK